ncbi:hypothetical protein PACTADRAFT_2022 [Pachysolen tannophilus NRRL Y-2460]|uniref:Peptide hydrolase n=1 Tax=Pachysolen tannophilus NRRL Y-2460 TaxID=669874 RepID=A0A1E4U0D2_PACTA|nr:hypothetical protein PACTADRAFT_2022 [Pachysolen tannophilus NRRL Y-2460]
MKFSSSLLLSVKTILFTSYVLAFPLLELQKILEQTPLEIGENKYNDLGNFQSEFVKSSPVDTVELQSLINKDALEERAQKLYELAERSTKEYGRPTRVIGSPGHWSTIGYIKKELHKLKDYYDVSTQDFEAVDGRVSSFSLLIDGVQPKSVVAMALTPPTLNKNPVNGPLVAVDGEGCYASDYPESVSGAIALIKRGTCAFGNKSQLAGEAGALAAIIYNNEPGSVKGTLGEPTGKEIATLGLDQDEGEHYLKLLSQGETLETTVYVDSYVGKIKTTNVIAETKLGDKENVVMLGAHSDSVSEGPGINDDGSGTISLLEVALQLSKFSVNNTVRFAWWAAEEEGLLGSDHYVSVLTPEEKSKIRLFMDYDMMASPNYAYQVYDANNVDNPVGSEELKYLYIDWYLDQGLNYTLIPFDGRSDYDAFIKSGIPGGGIATGAEGIKTKEEQALFGGTSGEWFDPCYHQLCDDLSNPNYDAWLVNTKLIAHSVATYATSFEGFPSPYSHKDIGTNNFKAPVFKYHGPHLII